MPLLILDDECDEASIEPEEETPTPELIANLWRLPEGASNATVAYVGYTATVAANLLQKPDNDLYPSDFVSLLRAPAGRESALTFKEPSPHAWYCGGEVFYERFVRPIDGGSSLLVEPIVTQVELAHDPVYNASLKQAIRTYIIGAALRLLEHAEWSLEDAAHPPEPHTMIVQASTSIADHEKWAQAIRAFLGIPEREAGASPEALDADLTQNADRWAEALASLEQSRGAINELQPHPWALRHFEWGEIWEKAHFLAPYIRLRVLNSAPGSVDDLDFEPAINGTGVKIFPRDLFSIIVGGGRLSRGLTIAGLSVSYFSRWADVPAEDTILQLSRWFGYRGPHLDYCRVFTTATIAAELVWIHTHDQEMRSRLASLMKERVTPREAGMVLSSIPHGLPTSKLGVGELRDISYSPCCRVLNFVEIGSREEHNETLALDLLRQAMARGPENVVTGAGTVRGVLSRGWSADELIGVLESLEYTKHNPNEDLAALGTAYRAHDPEREAWSHLPETIDPYAIAAYLRIWSTQAQKEGKTLPRFNLGIAYGSETADTAPFDIPLANREVSSEGFVNGEWIGRSEGWPGDQFFDSVPESLLIDDTAKRKEGADGLILMYVLHKDSLGRRGRGTERAHHSPMFGVSIPAGGPDLRRVILQPRGRT